MDEEEQRRNYFTIKIYTRPVAEGGRSERSISQSGSWCLATAASREEDRNFLGRLLSVFGRSPIAKRPTLSVFFETLPSRP